MQTTRSVREAAAALAALACALEHTLNDLGDRLALTPEEATEATADLTRLADELAALAHLLGAGLDPVALASLAGR
jgi:hypothetical protein